jgi:transcriptional regulator with XRE-family HTH domain
MLNIRQVDNLAIANLASPVQGYPVAMDIGDRIKLARKAAKLSQADVAARLGITASAISQWENGAVVNVRPANLLALCEALQVRAEWLVTGKEPMRPTSREDRAILDLLAQLTPEQRRSFLALAAAFRQPDGEASDG